jgi:S1-C subfamily serine protease
MLFKFKIYLFAAVAATALCGCESLHRPSDGARQSSYDRYHQLFTGDPTNTARQTYYVISGGPAFKLRYFDLRRGKLVLAEPNIMDFGEGLAIGVESDGYLLTAGHVLGSNNVVLGWFNGKLDAKPTRIVFKSSSPPPKDIALLKVDAPLEYCAAFADEPLVGERVFAVICYRDEARLGGRIGEAAGSVIRVTRSPSGSPADLVYTDVPLWKGDSGGPLLSSTGRLIGISTQIKFHWYGSKESSISFIPDKDFVETIIAEDRARHTAPNPIGLN